MKELQPSVPLFFTPRAGLLSFLCCLCGCLPFVPFSQEVVEFPLPFSVFERWLPAYQGSMPCCLGCLLTCLRPLLTAAFRVIFWHLRRRGHPVLLWTLNSPEEYE
jgi:hypothetical protein